MTMERKTVVDQIEITRAGMVQVRLALLIVDGEKEISSRYHRTAFDPRVENAAMIQMYAVNTHLLEMGEKPIPQEDIDRVMAHANTAK